MPSADALLGGLLRRDRALVIAGLLGVILVSWAYLLAGAGMESHEMGGMSMPAMRAEWTPGYFALMLAMWAVMMAAMMLPSAAPMILLHQTISRRRGGSLLATALFALGYVAVWLGFSIAATVLQWQLAAAALLSPMMQLSGEVLAALLFVAAGIYQWTPLKQSCLRRCRSPLDFIVAYWREGPWGSFAMGARHGVFCVGCCALLMLLLFAGGLMNIAWIAGLALFVLVEKLAPAGHWIGRAAGVALIVWGAYQLMF